MSAAVDAAPFPNLPVTLPTMKNEGPSGALVLDCHPIATQSNWLSKEAYFKKIHVGVELMDSYFELS